MIFHAKTNNVTVSVVGVHMREFRPSHGNFPFLAQCRDMKSLKNEGNKALITMMLLQLCKPRERVEHGEENMGCL